MTESNERPQDTFQSVFGPIAYHLFPDGCPIEEGTSSEEEEEASLHWRSAWPVYTQRSIITAAQATQSLAQLRAYAQKQGLLPAELLAVTLVAIQFLPSTGIPHHHHTAVHSPLLDPNNQASKHFTSLIQSLLPQASSSDATKNTAEAWRLVVHRLVTAVSFASHCGAPHRTPPSTAAERLTTTARQCVIRFLTLLVLYSSSFTIPPLILSYILHWIADPTTSLDARRLLYYIPHGPRPWPPYRQRQIHNLLLLVDADDDAVFTRKPDAGRSSTPCPRWTRFPNAAWEGDFLRRTSSSPADTERNTLELSIRRMDDDGRMPRPAKRLRSQLPRRHRLAAAIRNMDARAFTEWMAVYATASASDILHDGTFQYWSSRYASSSSSQCDDYHPFRRMMAMLKHKLYEQWQNDDIAKNAACDTVDEKTFLFSEPRQTLLRGLLALAQASNHLPEEIEQFLIQVIVPQWDGLWADDVDDDEYTLLHILTYIRPPRYECRTGLDSMDGVEGTNGAMDNLLLGSNGIPLNSLWCDLEKWFWNGTDDLRYALVSITLTEWICRWMVLDWSTEPANAIMDGERNMARESTKVNRWKMHTLRKLCQWVDTLLLKGFFVGKDESDLLKSAAIDFYWSIGQLLTRHEDPSFQESGVLMGPSASLLYHIFLSASVVHIDRICSLMVVYKDIYQKWKSIHVGEDKRKKDPSIGDDIFTTGIAQIQAFNGAIYDFCSLLWTGTTFSKPNTALNDTSESPPKSLLFQGLRSSTQTLLHDISTKESTIRKDGIFCPISSALSITRGAAFVGYATDFLKLYSDTGQSTVAARDGAVPTFSSDMIQGALKVQYLDYLKSRGLTGIHQFLHTFVRSLASMSGKR